MNKAASRFRYYVLRDETAVPCVSIEEWGQAFLDEINKQVARDTIGHTLVSTVFLGWNHQWDEALPPLIFETMIFGGSMDGRRWRYSTFEEAETMHQKIVASIRSGSSSDSL